MANAELMSVIRLGRFTECEAVAARGGAAARRAGRPVVAFGVWIQTACALSGSGKPHRCAAGGGLPAVAANPRHDGDRVSVPGRPGLRAVPARPPRRGAVAGPASSWPWRNGWTRPRSRPRARHDAGLISLAAGRHLEAAQLARAGPGRGGRGEPAGRAAGPGRGPWPAPAARTRPRPRCAGRRWSRLRSSDQPWALVPRMTRIQGLIAVARGDRAGARRRLTEAADGWRASPGARPRRGVRGQLRRPSAGRRSSAWSSRTGNCAASPPKLAGLDEFDELTEVPLCRDSR